MESTTDFEALKKRLRALLNQRALLREYRKFSLKQAEFDEEIGKVNDAIREVEKQIKSLKDAETQTQFYESAMRRE